MKQMDAWVLWDKWMQVLRVFIEHGAKIDTTLARIVSEGLKDVGSQYRSKRRMWKVLQQSIHSGGEQDIQSRRDHSSKWWELWESYDTEDSDGSDSGSEGEL